MATGFWFIGNAETGDVALLYPNGDFVGVNGSNYTAVISNNHVPKLDVPADVWADMAGRDSARLKEAAQDDADALKADGLGAGPAPADEHVKVTLDGTMHVGDPDVPAPAQTSTSQDS